MAGAGLKTHIWNNNLRSLILLATYPFLIALMVWAIAFLTGWGMVSGTYGYSGDAAIHAALRHSEGLILDWWPSILTVVAIWFTVAWFMQTSMVRALSHSRPVTREEEPELYNLLENLCISRGMTMPRLEIIETRARNAFASGTDERSYCITVTRGLLRSLQRDEIEAVLGHELTHIMNRDVRLLIVSVIFTGMIGFFAQMAWSSVRYGMFYHGGRRGGDKRVAAAIAVIALILWLGYIATMFTRFALSRRREFMADAGSVELTKNPDAMMRALMRIAGKDRIPEATDDIALMCIENSRPFFGLFATHPPLEERIRTIAEISGVPVPTLIPGRRAEDGERFAAEQDGGSGDKRANPWLTASRGKRGGNPWG